MYSIAVKYYLTAILLIFERIEMKIKIEEDLFDIVNRLREIDEEYFVVFDEKRDCFEIHNSKQENTYCLTVPFDKLDGRTIDLVKCTSVEYSDNIIDDIDNNNNKIEENNKRKVKSETDFMLREIYGFCNNSSKKFDENSFQTQWR